MFKLQGIDHLNIDVNNIDESVSFYKKYFGFEVMRDYRYESKGKDVHFVLLGNKGKAYLCLYESADKVIDHTSSPFSHIGFHVANYKEALEVAKKDALLDERYGEKEYEHSHSFYIIDPNGMGIEVSQVFGGGH